MAFLTGLNAIAFLLGRLLFGGTLAYLALDNLLDMEKSIAYAQSKGAPLASITVPATSGLVVLGSVFLILGIAPLIGSIFILAFLLPVTPIMHDFRGDADESQLIHFMKNAGLVGGALVFASLADLIWPYALG